MSADFTPKKEDYKILPPFKMQVLTNFPYIEADFDALTNYQLLCKVVEYLNKVIYNENELTEEVEGLYNAYVSLQNYINNYFDNLDVQEEVNNKLDEMAESGELTDIIAQYLGLAGIITFNTVAEMKAAENLVNGSKCCTLGYYEVNDGGGSLYKITNQEPDSYYEAINENLYAELIYDNAINVKQLGIDGLHTTNISNLINLINNDKIEILNFNPEEYTLDNIPAITKTSIKINGNGAIIKPTNTSGFKILFNITTSENCIIENLTIDGSNMPQDQWSEIYTANLCLRKAFVISAKNIDINNLIIKNMWGEGLCASNYENVSIRNTIMNKIGGAFYKSDTSSGLNDYFGDALYFSYHANNANILISNSIFNGYVETGEYHRGSRGGFVLESNDGTISSDIKTNVLIQNCNFTNFNRFLHKENYKGIVTINVTDSYIKQDASISETNNETKLYIEKSTIDHTNYNYNVTRGFRGFLLHANDCIINLGDTSSSALIQGNTAYYTNCIINNVQANSVFNNGIAHLTNCTLNMINDAVQYLIYGAYVYCNNCTFNNSTTDLKIYNSSGGKFICSKCTFNDVLPYSTKNDISNVFYSSVTTPTDAQLKNPDYFGMMKVYVNNVLISEPNICDILKATDEINVYTSTTSADLGNTAIPIIPVNMPTNFLPKLNKKYLMIIVPCNSEANRYAATFNNCYYATLSYNASKVASVSDVTLVGNPGGAGFAITIDTDSGTISKAAQYSQYVNKIVYFILPYSYKDEIATF